LLLDGLAAAEQAGKEICLLGSLDSRLAAQFTIISGLDDFHRGKPRYLGLSRCFRRRDGLLAECLLGKPPSPTRQ
jgi:hypothetical protein